MTFWRKKVLILECWFFYKFVFHCIPAEKKSAKVRFSFKYFFMRNEALPLLFEVSLHDFRSVACTTSQWTQLENLLIWTSFQAMSLAKTLKIIDVTPFLRDSSSEHLLPQVLFVSTSCSTARYWNYSASELELFKFICLQELYGSEMRYKQKWLKIAMPTTRRTLYIEDTIIGPCFSQPTDCYLHASVNYAHKQTFVVYR